MPNSPLSSHQSFLLQLLSLRKLRALDFKRISFPKYKYNGEERRRVRMIKARTVPSAYPSP